MTRHSPNSCGRQTAHFLSGASALAVALALLTSAASAEPEPFDLIDELGTAQFGMDTLSIGHGGPVRSILVGGTLYRPWVRVGPEGFLGELIVKGPTSILAADTLEVGAGHGRLAVRDGGAVQVDEVRLGHDLLYGKGALYIGHWDGPAAPGTISTPSSSTLSAPLIRFLRQDASLNFNHTGTDYTFGASLYSDPSAGPAHHSLNHYAGVTNLTAESKDFVGTTHVKGGTLRLTRHAMLGGKAQVAGGTFAVDGRFLGSVNVSHGGRLEGTGWVGGGQDSLVEIGTGGTIAPGNSVGYLFVDGDLLVSQGARIEVEVQPKADAKGYYASDMINVSGKATLKGGTVAHVGLAGDYGPDTTYTILTASGGVHGRFDGVASGYAFLTPTLGYGEKNVTLTLTRNETKFEDVAVSGNQRSVASAVERLPGKGELHAQIVKLDAEGARTAYDQLSGEVHASVTSGLVQDGGLLRGLADERLRSGLAGPGTAFSTSGPGESQAPIYGGGLQAWATGFGSWGETRGNANSARLERDTGGVLAGADAIVGAARLGFLAGYSRSSVEAAGRLSTADSDNLHVGLYGGTTFGAFSFRAGAAYTFHDIETRRSVSFPGFTDTLEAEYDAGSTQVFGEIGYAFAAGPVDLEPFAGLSYVHLDTDGFTERGGAASLTNAGTSTDNTTSTLGIRASTAFELGSTLARAHGALGWRHAFGDTTPLVVNAFAGGESFTVAGSSIAEDTAFVEAGLSFDITPDATFGVAYTGEFGSGVEDHGAKARFSFRF